MTCASKVGEFIQRLLTVGRGFDRITPQSDHAGERSALRFFVVHYQDARDGAFCFHSLSIVTSASAAC